MVSLRAALIWAGLRPRSGFPAAQRRCGTCWQAASSSQDNSASSPPSRCRPAGGSSGARLGGYSIRIAVTRFSFASATWSGFSASAHPSWSDVVNEALFRVATAGPLTTVQDRGRSGFARFGVTAGGPMDRVAHSIGQEIVGASAQGSALEIDVQGLSLDCIEGRVLFVLT